METLKINYKNNSSELCKIGKKYDTDKSSQRQNFNNDRIHVYNIDVFTPFNISNADFINSFS